MRRFQNTRQQIGFPLWWLSINKMITFGCASICVRRTQLSNEPDIQYQQLKRFPLNSMEPAFSQSWTSRKPVTNLSWARHQDTSRRSALTYIGLYRYKSLNYGTNAAAELFQHSLQETLRIGMANYSSKFIKNYATITEPLRELNT